MTRKPLEGYRILELGESMTAAVCGQLLSDFGAAVLKIEQSTEIILERSHYAAQNRGKASIVLDFNHNEDMLTFQTLVKSCDVLITDVPNLAQRTGFTQQVLQSWNPKLIYSLISGYGADGPYANRTSSDQTIQAESGIMSITGEEGAEPTLSGGPIAAYLGGAMGCIGTLMALIGELKTGQGRFVDVSTMDTVLFGLESQFSIYLKNGVVPEPIGNNYHLSAPVGVFPCKDGELTISVATDTQWHAFAEVLGHIEWIEDPRFITVQNRIAHYPEINEEVRKAFSIHTRDELIALLQSRHCVYGCLNNFRDVVAHPQVKHRQTFVKASYSDGDSYIVPSPPIRLNDFEYVSEYHVPELRQSSK